MIPANNPKLKTWITVPKDSDFPIQNIPFGVVDIKGDKVAATRIGDTVVSLSALFKAGVFSDILNENCFSDATLNSFLSYSKHMESCKKSYF